MLTAGRGRFLRQAQRLRESLGFRVGERDKNRHALLGDGTASDRMEAITRIQLPRRAVALELAVQVSRLLHRAR